MVLSLLKSCWKLFNGIKFVENFVENFVVQLFNGIKFVDCTTFFVENFVENFRCVVRSKQGVSFWALYGG